MATAASLLAAGSLAARMLATRDDDSTGKGGDDKDHDSGQCELLGSFALLVQGALGALALLSLVYKRWRERPQRPVKIWFFDVSKQVVGSILVHIANLLLALLSSGRLGTDPHPSAIVSDVQKATEEAAAATVRFLLRRETDENGVYHPNPCSFYLLNLAIDTTIGIAILIYALRLITHLCEMLPPSYAFSHGITSGDYGSPPKASSWIKQSIIYFAGLMIMKFIVALLFAIFPVTLGKFGDFLLGWTEGNRKVQIAFVMFIFPLIMNAMQYYVIDIFIKKQEAKSPHLPLDDEEDEERRPIRRGDEFDVGSSDDDSDEESDGDDLEAGKKKRNVKGDTNIPQIQPSSALTAAAAAGGDSHITKGKRAHGGKTPRTRTRSFEDNSFVYSTDEDDEHAIVATEEGRGLLKQSKGKKGGKPKVATGIAEYDPEVDGETTPTVAKK